MTDLIFLDRCLSTNRQYSYASKDGIYYLFHVTFSNGVSMYQMAFDGLDALLDFYYSLEVVRSQKPKATNLSLAAKIMERSAMGLWASIEKAKKVLKRKAEMAKGISNFTFRRKSDNKERPTTATTNPTLIPDEFLNNEESGKAKNPLQVPFFDLQKNVWRSFAAETILY